MRIAEALGNGAGSARAAAGDAARALAVAGQTAQRTVKMYPLWAMGVALGLGVLVGWMVKRR